MLGDCAGEVHTSVAHQAGLELTHEDVELTRRRLPRTPSRAREAVPRLREAQEVGSTAAAMRGQHRTHSPLAIHIGTHDHTLRAAHATEHRFAGPHRQAVDRQAEILYGPGLAMTATWHRLCPSAAVMAFERALPA